MPKYRCQAASPGGLRSASKRPSAASAIGTIRSLAWGKRLATSVAVAREGVMMADARRTALLISRRLTRRGKPPGGDLGKQVGERLGEATSSSPGEGRGKELGVGGGGGEWRYWGAAVHLEKKNEA